jgi:fimbrial chaperone protein
MLRQRLSGRARPFAWLVTAAFAMGLAPDAQAMRVSPMVAEMSSTGTGAVTRIEVQNLNRSNLPFETRITQIDYDAAGNLTETPADGDFLVFPPQGVLPPGARQVVRLQWVGAPNPPASKAYYLSVNELPVKLTPGAAGATGAQVQVIYHMKALVTVAPPGAKPNVSVASAVPTMIVPKSPPGSPPPDLKKTPPAPGVEVVVHNTGMRYAMMAGTKWTIDGTGIDGKPVHIVLTQDDLSRDFGVGYLAPLGGQRTFQVPTPPLRPGSIKVSFGS